MKATAQLMGEVSRAGTAASSFGAKFSCNLVCPFNYVSLYFCVSLKSATRCAFHKLYTGYRGISNQRLGIVGNQDST